MARSEGRWGGMQNKIIGASVDTIGQIMDYELRQKRAPTVII